MKILEIDIRNYKKIEVLNLELDGKSVKVAGTTGQGKTTAISTLWDIMETVGDPIRHDGKGPGATAKIRIVVGDESKRFVAERVYTAGDTKILIHPEGDKKAKISAKEFKSWVSSLAVNPHQILSMGPKDQTDALLRAATVPDGVDLQDIDTRREAAVVKRETAISRKSTLEGRLGIKPRKVERVKTQEVLDELTTRREDASRAAQERERLTALVASTVREHDELSRKLAECRERLERSKTELQELEGWVSEYIDQTKIDKLAGDLARSEEINREAQIWEAWEKDNAELEAVSAEVTEARALVSSIDAEKKAAVESIVWPVAGVSVADGAILYKGVPLVQCGESEKLLVCGALAAHEISQAKLRVVRLDGVESMSSEDFHALEAIFEEKDIQVLSSRVTRGDLEDGEILIHEGTVREVDG